MSSWHLLWIIPMSIIVGIFIGIVLISLAGAASQIDPDKK